MRTFLAILAGAALATAAAAQPQPDLIARIHFLGGDKISADTNHFVFTNEFCSAAAKALREQTANKLASFLDGWLRQNVKSAVPDGAARLRPLLDDLQTAEWFLEASTAADGRPEVALAVRLDDRRSQVWRQALLPFFASAPNKWEVISSGGLFIFNYGAGSKIISDDLARKMALEDKTWLSVEANWPRLAGIFPALKEFDFPKIQMQVAGIGTNLQFKGKLTLAQPLPPLEKWRIPTNTIHEPLASFTAARGAGAWLARQSWMQPLRLQPQPEQLFVWALAQLPFQTFAAEPVPDAGAALAQLHGQLTANTNWQGYFISPLAVTMTNNQISFGRLLFIVPFVKTVHEPAGDFLLGGFFPDTPRRAPLPTELFARLSQPGLVYYHWENTAGRVQQLPQLSQLLLMLSRHRQVDTQSVAGKWLALVGPTLGGTVTEAFQTAPNELAFTRTAPGGLTAIELLAFVDWLEAPDFPAPDLRLPVRPALKSKRPLSQLPGMSAAPMSAPAAPQPH